MSHHPDDEGSKHLWNIGKFVRDYTPQHPRRQLFPYSPPWEPEISQFDGFWEQAPEERFVPKMDEVTGWLQPHISKPTH
jgi:hypothetical protein